MKNIAGMVFLLLTLTASSPARGKSSLVNFSYLEHLTERIYFHGDSVDIVHIYADAPEYRWVEAKGEGITCVDDVARAAVAYLRHYELTKRPASREHAKLLLRFVMKMETGDGMFYNFIFADHSINANGQTSHKSFGWWAARGVWCMSMGYRLLKESDPEFADSLRAGVVRTFSHIDSLMMKYNQTMTMRGFRVPQWLLYESGADVTSELLLGLTEFYRAEKDSSVRTYIQRFASGLMMMQDGSITTYPYGAHRSWQTMWHEWGNSQTEALSSAGMVLTDTAMIRSAQLEADGFYSRLLINGFMKEMDVADSSKITRYDQIAYGVQPMSTGLLRLYDATHDTNYLKMAGLATAWLLGNNSPREQMYNPVTGRCFDGIHDSASVNKNAGAESTIEALMALVELEHYPFAEQYLGYERTDRISSKDGITGIFMSSTKHGAKLKIVLNNSTLTISEVLTMPGSKK